MSNLVELIPQDKSNACWLASSAMMKSWKTGIHYSITDTLTELDASGTDFSSIYNNNQGLVFDDNKIIAQTIGLTSLPPASYTLEYLTSLLNNSPIMAVIMASSGSNIAHIIVITSFIGDGTPEGTLLLINDPLPINKGKNYTIAFNDFLNKFEQVVAFENSFPDTDLTSQLFYFPSTSIPPNASSSDSTGNSEIDPSTNAVDSSSDKDSEGFRLLDYGSWSGSATLNYEGGQVMHFQIKNTNILGTTIKISSNLSGDQSLIILPQQTIDLRFDCFGSEPMGWSFDVSTDSDAFIVVWKLFASWLPGDPQNG